jgi:hypothetical protein
VAETTVPPLMSVVGMWVLLLGRLRLLRGVRVADAFPAGLRSAPAEPDASVRDPDTAPLVAEAGAGCGDEHPARVRW